MAVSLLLAVAPHSLAFPLPPANAPQEASEPTASDWVEQGWALVPAYTGEHRWSLSSEERKRTQAAWHILNAATLLDPENTLAWWRRGHTAVLLATDDKTRGNEPLVPGDLQLPYSQWEQEALTSLKRSLELAPSDPWSNYALAICFAQADQVGEAQRGLLDTIAVCSSAMESEGTEGTAAWISFKCREWLAEVQMRAGQFDLARESVRAFYGDFGENDWPLKIALAECALRERDFKAARLEYQQIIQAPAFASDPQAHAALGYLAGLLGDADTAAGHLRDAIRRERTPELYARLWLWILSEGDRTDARADLQKFLSYPPPQVTEWDLALGRFSLGEGTPKSFLAQAQLELQSRWDAGLDPGELLCEAEFYVGLRLEADAALAEDSEAQEACLKQAAEAYRRCLTARPTQWKWEWSYARLGLRRVSPERSRVTRLSLPGPTDGTLYQLHRLGDMSTTALEPQIKIDADWQPGDLLMILTRPKAGVAEFGYRLQVL